MENQTQSRYSHPAAYIKVFFRRKWYLITTTSIGLIAGIMVCFLLPRTWQASTIILIEEEKIINPLIKNLAVSTTAIQRMQSIRENLLGWNSLVELTKKLNLAKNVQSQLEFEALINKLKRNISVEMRNPGRQTAEPTSNVVRISYFGQDPQETQVITQALTDILMEQNLESQTKETDVAIKFITEQLSIYKRKIKETELAKLNDQLKALLVDSTEEHPLVKDLRQQIAVVQKQLDSGEYNIKTTGSSLSAATQETLQNELDKIISKEAAAPMPPKITDGTTPEPEHDANTAIYKVLLMDKVDSSLARDIGVNEAIYNMLLQKLETAKITQRLEASRAGTRYTIIEPPRLPLMPVKPNKAMVLMMGLLLGAASGVGLVFAREFMDQSIIDIQDAKLTLDLPVLGAISRITTQEEVTKEKNRKKKLIISFSVVSFVLVVSAMLYAFFKR
ncbi:MAG: GNVR domain-containing protein [Candidatus Omnitrophota bacterium]